MLLNVSQNPPRGIFKLNLEEIGTAKIEVIDALGEIVYITTLNNSDHQNFDLAEFPKGYCFLRIFMNKNVYFEKIFFNNMARCYSFLLAYFTLVSNVSGQDHNGSVALGLSGGIEGIVNYYYPGYKNVEYNSSGIFTIGAIESLAIDNVDIFISQYYSHVSISKEYQSNYHATNIVNYIGSYLVVPFGLDIRLSKNKINYLFLSAAYRLEFVFNQEITDEILVTQKPEFSLSKQTVEAGPGINFRLSDALQFKLKTVYIFKPFYNENILLTDVSDSRIKITISILKYF